ncbi:MAG: group 1 glycosyl [Bacteroidetes bacterium]|nr:MAG: group 1 glycosyl [Bacteroidota bacterium]
MGGIERALSTLANYFISNGKEVHFLTFFPFEPFFTLDKRIHFYSPPYSFSHTGRNALQTSLYYVKMLSPLNGYIRKEIRQIRPDVILCFGDWFPHAIMLQLKGLKIPFYYCNRSNPLIKYNWKEELIRKVAYRFAPPAGIIAQTSAAAERKKRILGNKIPIKIIPNPVLKLEHYPIEKENWIVSVGRLHIEKGFVRLMEAFAQINAPEWKLVLAGEGVHAKEIKQKSVDLGISNRVVFLGKVLNISELLFKSKIFVLASHREGFPNALCEGMAAGLACISFDIVAGPSDIIENNVNGYLVEDKDIKGLAEKMQYLIEHPETMARFGFEAKKITEHLSINKIGDMFLNFILKQN